MKKCYCYETGKEYESIKACLIELGLSMNKYGRLTSTLRYSQVAEVSGYHIGYNQEVVVNEMDEWCQPRPDLDVEVNRKGEVRKKSTKLLKNPTYDGSGYQYLMINDGDGYKAFRVHRLIAQAFLPDYDEHYVVDHLNGIRDDNRAENLCIKTQTENLAARDENNKPLYQELRRLVKTYGYDKTYELLSKL